MLPKYFQLQNPLWCEKVNTTIQKSSINYKTKIIISLLLENQKYNGWKTTYLNIC